MCTEFKFTLLLTLDNRDDCRTRALQSTLNLNYLSPRPLVKNLTFQSHDLGKEVTIMLAWSPNVDGLYEDVFPIVWKVSKFGKSGPYRATATYTAQAQVDSGKVISAATSVNINNIVKTTSTKANDVYHFSPLPRHQAARGVASGWHQYHISYSYHVFII
ncbi:hypothetical protein C8R48DRAFT_676193 [Suillus tomentosus]|nr:hypothetical protein C8R48DRAFT_676193 [Suillus tomentosus]